MLIEYIQNIKYRNVKRPVKHNTDNIDGVVGICIIWQLVDIMNILCM
jgi:hypothetical protein